MIRFAWEDWNEKHSRTQKRSPEARSPLSGSSTRVRQHSSTAQKAIAETLKLCRSPNQVIGSRSTSKAIHSTGHKTRSVQVRAKPVNVSPMTAEPQPIPSKHTSSKRHRVKSVQSRGTQLDCTPVPFDVRSSVVLPSGKRLPGPLRQLEQTPLETASLAWNHYRSASVGRQTKHLQQPKIPADDTSGSIADVSINVE